jgi:hypothetical protein
MRQAIDNPNLPLIPFELNNPHIEFSYPAENHTANHEQVYRFLADPDGSVDTDPASNHHRRSFPLCFDLR